MKKALLLSGLFLATFAEAQFTTGTVSLGTTGMTVKLETSPTTATMTLTGPDTSYLGIGFGGNGPGTGMQDGADGFIYNSTSTNTTNLDYTFVGYMAPNADAVQDWTITSNTVSAGTRTIVATRSLSGGTGDAAFANTAGTMNIFFARGNSTNLAYHNANRGHEVLTKSGTLGINDVFAENEKVKIYPNPAREKVYFKNADKIQSVDIYEATGRKVKSADVNDESITVSDLSSGNYYLEIKLKDGTSVFEKLIKK